MNAPFVQPALDRPHGLWSLWDMLELNARAFYGAVNAMQHMETMIEGRRTTVETDSDGGVEIVGISDPIFINSVSEILDRLELELNVLQATLTLCELKRLQHLLKSDFVTWERLSGSAKEIRSRLADELNLRTVLVIETDKQNYFKPSAPLFGSDFAAKFASNGVYELDEAAKCLALGRSTAGVFHLMRIMEVGIRSLARCLQIPDPVKPADRNWGKILEKIWNDGIEKKWPKAGDRLVGDGALFEELHASLDAVKNPWRNSTMHVEKKYTDDEAEHIFVSVKGFMKKLASRCDEDGKPCA